MNVDAISIRWGVGRVIRPGGPQNTRVGGSMGVVGISGNGSIIPELKRECGEEVLINPILAFCRVPTCTLVWPIFFNVVQRSVWDICYGLSNCN